MEQLLNQGDIPSAYFFSSRSMTSWEVKRLAIVLQENGFKMCQCVLFAK